MTTIPVIETPRFRLRAPERRDFDAYAAMWADGRVTRYISGNARTRTESWGKFSSMIGMWALMGYGYWIFADRRDDSFIGGGGLFWADRGVALLDGYPEAGWSVTPDLWGTGAATEIMSAALHWGDTVLAAPEVRCIINPGHGASEAVAAKLGFTVIGQAEMQPDPVNVYARLRPAD
jgi:RimJ/RimL family protein N-acetyltransferase